MDEQFLELLRELCGKYGYELGTQCDYCGHSHESDIYGEHFYLTVTKPNED